MPGRSKLDVRRKLTLKAQQHEYVRRVMLIHGWLAGGVMPRAAARKCQEEFGLSRVQSNRYVGSALEILRKDASEEPVEVKRARYELTLQSIIERALARKRVYYSGKGKKFEVDDPDFKAAAQCTGLLMDLDGAVQKK